jgi:hypothetical protein
MAKTEMARSERGCTNDVRMPVSEKRKRTFQFQTTPVAFVGYVRRNLRFLADDR